MKNRFTLLLLTFLWTLVVSGCDRASDPLKYMQAVEKDGALNQMLEHEEFLVSVHYRPHKYMAYRELLKHGVEPDSLDYQLARVSKDRQVFDKGLYFEVRISLINKANIILYGINDQEAYARRVDYLNQGVFNDFYLLSSNYTKIKASGHSFQNTFGAGVNCDIVVVFPIEDLDDVSGFDFVYEDRIFGINKERLMFHFDVRQLRKW
ncbi:MAG: hypothetical protein GXY94_01180 [Bacteroidales bacterium]|nr:hypothetical protein [Bacteroidales bacterium]